MIIIFAFVLCGCQNIINKDKIQAYVIGDTVEKNDIVITVNSARWGKDDEGLSRKEGYKWLIIDVTIQSKRNKPFYIWPIAFQLNNEFGEILNKEWLTEGVYPDSKTSGEIAFWTRDTNSKWEFTFNFYGNEQAIFIIEDVK